MILNRVEELEAEILPSDNNMTGYLGYSGTPLAKKLGIKEGFRVGLVNPPNNFLKMLGSLPENVGAFN